MIFPNDALLREIEQQVTCLDGMTVDRTAKATDDRSNVQLLGKKRLKMWQRSETEPRLRTWYVLLMLGGNFQSLRLHSCGASFFPSSVSHFGDHPEGLRSDRNFAQESSRKTSRSYTQIRHCMHGMRCMHVYFH